MSKNAVILKEDCTYEQRKEVYEVMRDHSDSIDYDDRYMTATQINKIAKIKTSVVSTCLDYMFHELHIVEYVANRAGTRSFRLVPLEWRKVMQGRQHKKSELNGYADVKEKPKDYEILGAKIDTLPRHMREPFMKWMDDKMGKIVHDMTPFDHWYEFEYLLNGQPMHIPAKDLRDAFNAGMHYQESKRLR